MRGCFVDVDLTPVAEDPSVDSSLPSSLPRRVRDVAYALANSLAGQSLVLDASRARELLSQESEQERLYGGARRQMRDSSVGVGMDDAPAGQRAGHSRQLSEAIATLPPPPPRWDALPISEQLDQAYVGVAAASVIALLCSGGGDAVATYRRCVLGSILLLLPAFLAVRSLGNRPSRYCCVPRHPEAMRKVGMRCR